MIATTPSGTRTRSIAQAVRTTPPVEHLPDRIGERRDLPQPFGHASRRASVRRRRSSGPAPSPPRRRPRDRPRWPRSPRCALEEELRGGRAGRRPSRRSRRPAGGSQTFARRPNSAMGVDMASSVPWVPRALLRIGGWGEAAPSRAYAARPRAPRTRRRSSRPRTALSPVGPETSVREVCPASRAVARQAAGPRASARAAGTAHEPFADVSGAARRVAPRAKVGQDDRDRSRWMTSCGEPSARSAGSPAGRGPRARSTSSGPSLGERAAVPPTLDGVVGLERGPSTPVTPAARRERPSSRSRAPRAASTITRPAAPRANAIRLAATRDAADAGAPSADAAPSMGRARRHSSRPRHHTRTPDQARSSRRQACSHAATPALRPAPPARLRAPRRLDDLLDERRLRVEPRIAVKSPRCRWHTRTSAPTGATRVAESRSLSP